LGLTRTFGKAETIRRAGADVAVVDALDGVAVRQAVISAKPDVIVHEMTALSGVSDLRRVDRVFAVTNRTKCAGKGRYGVHKLIEKYGRKGNMMKWIAAQRRLSEARFAALILVNGTAKSRKAFVFRGAISQIAIFPTARDLSGTLGF
jgi:hypothetical protein